MKKTITLLACLLTGSMLQAQAVPMALEDWKTTQGTQNFFYKNVTKTDVSGNVYVAGATMNNGFPDMLVAKYNAAGNLQWIQQFAGTAPNGVDAIAGMYVTGTDVYVTGAVSNNSVTPETDCITMKLSGGTGSVLWSTSYAGAAGAYDAGKDITLDGSGNVYVSGASYNGSGNTDYLVLKYNSSGTQQWASTWDYTGADDGGYKIALSGTNVNVTGAVTTTTPGTYKMSTIKLAQSSGSITATNTSTAVTTSSVEAVTDMALDGSGNVIIVGSQYTGGQHDVYVQKLNASTLSSVFIYTWDGGASLDDYAKAVTTDASGNVFVAGFSSTSSLGRELTLIKLNSSGTHQWTQTSGFSGDDEAADLVTDANGDVYVAGYNSVSPANKDYYTTKYNTSGTKVWETTLSGKSALNDYATNITVDSLNNVVVTGQNEIAPGEFQFITARYVQKDVIVPTDINTEEPSDHFWYYRNEGQLRDINDSLVKGVLFHTDNTSPNICIHKNKMSFVFAKADTVIATVDTIQRLEMTLKGANAQTKAFPLETQDFAISYFMGLNRDFTGINGNRKLITPDIYPNIDLIYSSNGNGIKYYYIVKPGGNPANIQLQFDGLASYNLNPTTNELTISTNCGAMSFAKPTAYQLSTSNTPIAITGWTPDWQSGGSTGSYDFNIGAYSSTLTLVIVVDRGPFNPAITAADNLTWNTYQGGNMDEYCRDLRVDRSGNIYALNESWSGTFFMSSTSSYGTAQTNKAGAQIMKYDMDGKPLKQIYITTATGGTLPMGLTILNNSHIVVVGSSAPQGLSMPIGGNPSGALTSTVGPGWIMKIDPTLSNGLLWRTYYPGGIIQDVDNKLNGDIYLCSISYTSSALVWPQSGALNLATPNDFNSEMVAKFNSNGVPQWSSFVGAKPMGGYQGFSRIKVDTTKNEFYIFGLTNGSGGWVGYNHYGTYANTSTFSDGADAYIKKFNSSDSMKVSILFSGNANDQLADVAFLANGDICFAGYTGSTDTASIIKNPYDGSYFSKKRAANKDKGWVLKFDSNFNWKYGTLYGDSARITQFKSVSTDVQHSNILMAGYTEGMPGSAPGGFYYKNTEAQGDGAFVSMDALNQVTWSTAMGSAALNDMVGAAAYNPKNQNWDFAGTTLSNSNYPVRSYPNSYIQWSNYGTGHSENVTGRFGAIVPVVGIQETTKSLSGNNISLYPNPAQNSTNLYFRLGLEGSVKITICNAIGQVIELRQLNNIEPNTTLNIATSCWAEGLYFVNIQNETRSESIKFINFK